MKASTLSRSAVRATPSVRSRAVSRRAVVVKAKYGEDSKYFDLKDLENTTGSWELYGQEDKKRYPDLQVKFFEQAAEVLTKREALVGFIALAGVSSIGAFGAVGSKLLALPIAKGPQTAGESGKGGSIKKRL
ncbi:MAG: hypothetical protein WDW36_004434 [Sanguina aurantia]